MKEDESSSSLAIKVHFRNKGMMADALVSDPPFLCSFTEFELFEGQLVGDHHNFTFVQGWKQLYNKEF